MDWGSSRKLSSVIVDPSSRGRGRGRGGRKKTNAEARGVAPAGRGGVLSRVGGAGAGMAQGTQLTVLNTEILMYNHSTKKGTPH